MTLREKISELFQYSMGHASFEAYLAGMNTMGKITAKSQLELIVIILTTLEELEQTNSKKVV